MTDAIDLIRTKRDGGHLDAEEIRWFVDAYTAGAVPDEQAAALLMAIVFRGLAADELASWTEAMLASGARLDLGDLGRPTVDKHSTGGVGDKVSLVLVPLVVACGAAVPQLSGRGLGHTGGTLDKLESIPGFRTELSPREVHDLLAEVGGVIAAAGPDLAPADRKLYALRDVTGTVESIPLIASSIMSKKLAEGTGALVLDVKVGSGAFLPEVDRARALAETMVGIGDAHGLPTVALLTAMDRPLGRSAGNALEVAEAVETLSGGGPDDLRALTLALASEMVALAGLDADPAAVLDSGAAIDAWRRIVSAQGGDPAAPLPRARTVETLLAERTGTLVRLDARAVGVAAWRLGAGRARKEDPVSATAGVTWHATVGEHVTRGQVLLELHTDRSDRVPAAREALQGAISIDQDEQDEPTPLPLLVDRVAS